jgi:hypothetical protein
MNVNLSDVVTAKHTPVKVYTDAALDQKNDVRAGGWLFTDHVGKPIERDMSLLPEGMTINEAETECVNRAICELERYEDINHVKILTDSTNAVRRADAESSCLDVLNVEKVERAENFMADTLAKYILHANRP